MLSVTICRTCAPERARRFASLSVAQSPTRAAAAAPRSTAVASTASSSAVLPLPGLDTQLLTLTPRPRTAAQTLGQEVVLLQDALAQVDDAGGHGVGHQSRRT